MVYEVDGNPQLDSRNWSMYSNTLRKRDSDSENESLKVIALITFFVGLKQDS